MRLIRFPESDSFELFFSRRARDYYRLDDTIRQQSRSVSDFQLARIVAQSINERRDAVRNPAVAVEPGWINAAWTYADIVITLLDSQTLSGSGSMDSLERALIDRLGFDDARSLLDRFVEEYPPSAVYRNEVSTEAYLEGMTSGIPNRRILLQNLVVVWLFSQNRAFHRLSDLFDISGFIQPSIFGQFDQTVRSELSAARMTAGSDTLSLLDMLLTPSRLFPESLEEQLDYMRRNWRRIHAFPERRILSALDMISEEHKPVFGPGPGPVEGPGFDGLEAEPERFSPDLDWMPRLVLLAKNAYVWLYQLSHRHNRPIRTLDEIPDEELQAISRRGISGLWLIGVWERSRASKTIKNLCGNPDADASAYSLIDYVIAEDLGGEPAFEELKKKAWKFGIRLAGDMVPNHMGIDSRWVIRHPDRFISTRVCPFPSYSFTGADLSPDPGFNIQIEDHYFDRTDAAVVFRRTDRSSGDVIYIYHGNDGTVMPWNDTAQLDYLNPATRSGVIDSILRVAKRFPIIRFDAAMTLAKRHYQRLWYPEPGTGGSIASRAEHGLTKDAFNEAMPEEFWREVVERIAAEVPDTLLLAEAFWLMEGYFVRTLGMHRVYNSAFMNMLRDELNAQYRSVITNTIEFDRDILKRYVNFMNNPDEKTAVEQFGKFSKYFGVCVMLATLPGLPMFGHGQFEGFTEKYGMEYRRAYRNEQPDERFMRYHDRIISPLLHKRRLFADAEQFRLYDFTTLGTVDENVYAYSNRHGTSPTLIVFNNRNGRTRGRIQWSTPVRDKRDSGESPMFLKTELYQALGLQGGDGTYCIWREQVSGLQFIRRSDELIQNGLELELGPYEHRAFLDVSEVTDDSTKFYSKIADYLEGRGTWEIGEAAREIEYRDVLRPFRDVVSELFTPPEPNRRRERTTPTARVVSSFRHRRRVKLRDFYEAVHSMTGQRGSPRSAAMESLKQLRVVAALSRPRGISYAVRGRFERHQLQRIISILNGNPMHVRWLEMSRVLAGLGRLAMRRNSSDTVREWMDEWLLGRLIMRRAMEWDVDEEIARRMAAVLRAGIALESSATASRSFKQLSRTVANLIRVDSEFRWIIGTNEFDASVWFRKESWEGMIDWMRLGIFIRRMSVHRRAASRRVPGRHLGGLFKLEQLANRSNYRLDTLLNHLAPSVPNP